MGQTLEEACGTCADKSTRKRDLEAEFTILKAPVRINHLQSESSMEMSGFDAHLKQIELNNRMK